MTLSSCESKGLAVSGVEMREVTAKIAGKTESPTGAGHNRRTCVSAHLLQIRSFLIAVTALAAPAFRRHSLSPPSWLSCSSLPSARTILFMRPTGLPDFRGKYKP